MIVLHDCTNYLCSNVEHLKRIQIYHDELIAACISASSAIPDTSNNKNKGNIPGWNDHVKQYKQNAVFGITCGMRMDHQEKAPWPT